MDFLSSLEITEEEKEKLRAFGARTPVSLLAIYNSAKENFEQYFGPARSALIITQLERLLTDEDKQFVRSSPTKLGSLGAIMEKRPKN